MQQRRLRVNLDHLVDIADLHGNVDANRALDFNGDRLARETPESGLFHLDLVLTGNEIDELVVARAVGHHSAAIGSAEVGERHGGLWYSAASGVIYGAHDRSVEGLPKT